ncbi:MAG: transporter substrate-binding protein [Herbinix sp.]|jgi:ABC-type glycerol-3-phosphate transport system substrate-binding protein|nr:transporter substrate-binding protein [Herbinix sp.]
MKTSMQVAEREIMSKLKRINLISASIITLCVIWGIISAYQYSKGLHNNISLPFNEAFYDTYLPKSEGKVIYDFHITDPAVEGVIDVQSIENYEDKVVHWSSGKDEIVLHVVAKTAGNYELRLEYQPLISDFQQISMSLLVNGKKEEGYENIRLLTKYRYQDYEFKTNDKGNHIFPEQELLGNIMVETLNKGSITHDPSPIIVKVNQGENEIRLKLNSGSLYLGRISLVEQEELVDFETYQKQIANINPNVKINENEDSIGETFLLEAEQFYYKNNIDISIVSKTNYLLSPYKTNRVLLNSIDGTTFKNSGDQISYYIDIKNPGFYSIGVRGFMLTKQNSPVFMDVKVDGSIPFKEFCQARFEYSQKLKNQLLQTPVYLEKGIHEISFVLNGKPYYVASSDIEIIVDEINQLAMDIKKLTGNNQDKKREWDLTEYLPTLVSDLSKWENTLKGVEAKLLEVTNGESTEEIQNIRFSMKQLEKLMQDPNRIPSKLSILSQGSSSILEMLSKVLLTLNLQEFTLDQIIVTNSREGLPEDHKNLFYSMYEGVHRFVKSFEKKNVKATKEENTIDIWVKNSRQYIDVLQSLVDESFTEKTGIQVNLSLMNDQGKLTLANAANKQPDGVLGIDSFYVNDLAVRGSLTDLREFDGINEVLEDVAKGSLMQMIIDDKLYGLPQTQDFYILFYRKDIFEEFGFEVPQTWDEVLLMLPALQRNGMNFYTPLSGESAFKSWPSTMPFYAQFGADIYKKDGSGTIIDSDEGLQAMKFMTELFKIYGMPIQIKNFYNNFRFGETPIGVGNFPVYIQLKNGAPEINNRWGVALLPGRKNEDGEIERWCTGGSQAVAIFEKSAKKDKAWEFMKWWLSEEIQTQYTERLQNIYGKEYLWNSGNLKALSQMPIEPADLEVIMEQVQWVKEAPKLPGGYFTEREVSNAWNKIVFDDVDVRTAVDDAVMISNREITRKLEEFGYMKNGEMVKPYLVPTIEDVERWLKDE